MLVCYQSQTTKSESPICSMKKKRWTMVFPCLLPSFINLSWDLKGSNHFCEGTSYGNPFASLGKLPPKKQLLCVWKHANQNDGKLQHFQGIKHKFIHWYPFFCWKKLTFYPSSHNHGSVENYPKWKETNIFEIHAFSTEPWLWEEG